MEGATGGAWVDEAAGRRLFERRVPVRLQVDAASWRLCYPIRNGL